LLPGLLSENSQLDLLSKLLHRDLANEKHTTNIHKHYNIPYGLCRSITSNGNTPEWTQSFFNIEPSSSEIFLPFDAKIHKPLSINQFLNRKLRWMTLGGQYDWTNKAYPEEKPPEFPKDVKEFINQAFPQMQPEAAIVNVYSPGDTLSLHRDVSEISDKGLVSISIGCEAIFVVGLDGADHRSKWISIRLRSGDAIYMSGPARYAWHGVPRIIPNTCPSNIQSWPAVGETSGQSNKALEQQSCNFELWRDWLASKRINVNVRQMF
jgi:alkylated DNA repair protein alkB homolog 1